MFPSNATVPDVSLSLLRRRVVDCYDHMGIGPNINKGRFCNTIASVALVHTRQFKAISDCRQRKFSQPVIQNKHSHKVALKPVRQTLAWCGQREVSKRSYFNPRSIGERESFHRSSGTCQLLCSLRMFMGFLLLSKRKKRILEKRFSCLDEYCFVICFCYTVFKYLLSLDGTYHTRSAMIYD